MIIEALGQHISVCDVFLNAWMHVKPLHKKTMTPEEILGILNENAIERHLVFPGERSVVGVRL